MNAIAIELLAHHPWLLTVGYTLLHFIWQAALVYLVVAVLLRALRGRIAGDALPGCLSGADAAGPAAIADSILLVSFTAIGSNQDGRSR